MTWATLLEYKDIFNNEEPDEIITYVRMLGREFIMTLCSALLNDRENNLIERQTDIEYFLTEFFGTNIPDFLNPLLQLVQIKRQRQVREGLLETAYLFHETQMLYLMSMAYDETVQEQGLLNNLMSRKMVFLKACLAYNTEFIQREDKVISRLDHMNPEFARAMGMMCVHLAYGDYSTFIYEEVLLAQLLKSVYLFQFLEKEDPDLLSRFLEANQVERWKDYVLELFHIGVIVGKMNNGNLRIPEDDDFKNAKTILFKMSEASEPKVNDWDFVMLRESPIYRTCDGDYKILSRVFVAEKLYRSLYFELSELNSRRKRTVAYRSDFQSFITTEFSEHYLFYKVVGESFPKVYKKKSGEEFKNEGIKDKEPDYYIRNGNKILLWENKDNLFSADVKTSFDFDRIEAFVKDRLYYSEKKNGIEARAVLQLVRSTDAAYKEQLLDKYKARTARVFPIVITYERAFQTPGINLLLNQWFQEELANNADLVLYKTQINPIVVLNIDTLVLCRTKFYSRHLRFEDMLKKYAMEILNKPGLDQYPSFEDYFYKEVFNGGVQVQQLCKDVLALLKENE